MVKDGKRENGVGTPNPLGIHMEASGSTTKTGGVAEVSPVRNQTQRVKGSG